LFIVTFAHFFRYFSYRQIKVLQSSTLVRVSHDEKPNRLAVAAAWAELRCAENPHDQISRDRIVTMLSASPVGAHRVH
jgi:hypothetical protein|tara:strand:+ start:42 stop:275 length:234 start_codon:yes stop_codon:yes gene_type:complete